VNVDRPVAQPSSSDEHWAPDHLVLDRRVLQYAGRLLVEHDDDGHILEYSPLAGMAAVEQRYPAWALGPFGRVEPERGLPELPGVYALVEQGVVRYVGSTVNLARTFDARHGLGHISRRDCQLSKHEERCRLNRLVIASAKAGRVVDVYLITTQDTKRRPWTSTARAGAAPAALATQLARSARGSWHLPS
jgi:hypothetical protein